MNPFKSQKPLSIWLSEYAISHQNTTNKRIHYICVPIIFLTIVGLLYHISGYLLAVGFIYACLYCPLLPCLAFMRCVLALSCLPLLAFGFGFGYLFWRGLDNLLGIK